MLTQICAGIVLLAMTWLVARAFRRHPGWGLGVLLLSPLSATAFGIKYWNREKLPFLVYISSFTIMLALVLSLFSAWGGWDLIATSRIAKQGLRTFSLTRADADAFRKTSLSFMKYSGINYQDELLLARIQRHLDREEELKAIIAKAETDQTWQDEDDINDIMRKTPVATERYRLVYKQITVADARNYIGSTVKVTRKGVIEKEYRLTGASANSLELSQRGRSGSFSFSLQHKDIGKIRVLTRQPD
jgi:hypothetical protein